MLTVAGLQVPLIPLIELAGRDGTAPPAQSDKLVPKSNTGTAFGVAVTCKSTGVPHCPAAGVNVYVAEAWLSIAEGLQVPVIPLVEVVGNAGTLPPSQIVRAVPKLKVGVTLGLTVTLNVVDVAHCPAVGVNV